MRWRFAFWMLMILSGGAAVAADEAQWMTSTRQLTFEGKRSGEGYFGPEGRFFVFQSEREAGNPFYQIYLTDLETGDTHRVSPGYGKTTCAWIHPSQQRVLFASTHGDPNARQKMADELAFRASGQERRYAWDYDETYDLWSADFSGSDLHQITQAIGYDAEGSWSPDGRSIVFASNRNAYREPLSDDQRAMFERDKSFMIDLFMLDVENGSIRQLTDMPGYDGGPFFSHDGRQICWRHFSEDGATAEIWVMDRDGGQARALTQMGAMSWAPYFHPSGEYLIFTTNVHGFANFELYLVGVDGGSPVRVSYTDGFDGLPVFSPDGTRLAWTSNRTSDKSSQIFMAEWNHEAALAAIKQSRQAVTRSAIHQADISQHIHVLASEAMGGRGTGTAGERLAAEYIAGEMQQLGLGPAGDEGGYFQSFEFKAGVSLGELNQLRVEGVDQGWQVDHDWRPLTFSKTGEVPAAPIVFAGYGIVAPEAEGQEAYDSFVHLDVAGAWVLAFRFAPEGVDEAQRRHLNRYSSLRYKAMVARDKGALGLIVVSGPHSKVEKQLVPLRFDAAIAGSGIHAISVSDAVAEVLMKSSGKDLGELQDQLNQGQAMMGIKVPQAQLSAVIDLVHEEKSGLNVLGVLPANLSPKRPAIALGAHFDHLGLGLGGNSLARNDERGKIHYGADDNASGVAGVLEIAQFMLDARAQGKLDSARDLYFLTWSGEELGLLGSSHFVGAFEQDDLSSEFGAYLNLDMIGRSTGSLVLQGVGSSTAWARYIERANVPIGLSIQTSNDSYLPTDATSFYLKKVPILSAFTGAHEDYHTPRDTADKIDLAGAEKVTRLVALMTRQLLLADQAPDYVAMEKPTEEGERRGIRVYLGTIPDYAQGDVEGVKLSGVAKGGPAEQAGVQAGDVIVSLAGKTIANIYDYTYAMDTLNVGEAAPIVVLREGAQVQLSIVPGSRD